MPTKSESLLARLRSIGLLDDEIFSLFSAASHGHQKNGGRDYVFTKTDVAKGTNEIKFFAKIRTNKDGNIKEIDTGEFLSSIPQQNEFIDQTNRWISGADGYVILLRPMFSHLPLKGFVRWRDVFRIRPLSNIAKIGRGLDFFSLSHMPIEQESYLGPPYPFVLEVAVPKSEFSMLESTRGLRLLNRYEALLSVLLTQHVVTARTLRRQWTAIWDGEKVTYHLLHGGFDFAEEGRQETFSDIEVKEAPIHTGSDYYNHFWARDSEVFLPPNLSKLLQEYAALQPQTRAAFDRACYWYSLGLENRSTAEISIVAFANSVECLLPRQSKATCATCKRPSGKGPTKLFLEHLEKYASLPESLSKQRNELYSARSKLVHGLKVEKVDLDWLSPLRESDDTNFFIEFTARRGLVNWLADPNRNNPTKSDSQ